MAKSDNTSTVLSPTDRAERRNQRQSAHPSNRPGKDREAIEGELSEYLEGYNVNSTALSSLRIR